MRDSSAKHGGILLRRTEICSDSLQVAMILVKRGRYQVDLRGVRVMHVAIISPSQVIDRGRSESLVLYLCARSRSRHDSLPLFDSPRIRLPSNCYTSRLNTTLSCPSLITAFCP